MTREFSSVTQRVAGRGPDGWAVHRAAWAAKARGESVIVLSIGDPEFNTPAPIIQTATAAMEGGDTHYTDIRGRASLREAIAEYVNRISGTSFGSANVIVGAGTQNALFNASLCLLAGGDEVIIPDPGYLTYEATLGVGGAALVSVPQPAASGFRLDPAAIEAAVTSRTKAIMVNSPSNPSGVVATKSEIRALAKIAVDHDLWVLSDEVYAQLVFNGTHHSVAAVPEMAGRTVIVGGVSKSHAMTGWRIGWAVGPEDLIDHMENVALAMNYGIPGFIQEAAQVAVSNHDSDVDEMRAIYQRRCDLVLNHLANVPGLSVLAPAAGMFVLLDVRATGLSSRDFAWDLFNATGVAVLDAANFGPAADGWVRISFAIGDDDLAEGCRRIFKFCHSLA